MRLFVFFCLVVSGTLCFPSPQELKADENVSRETPLETARRLQQSFDRMHSLTLNFYQDTRGEMTGRPRKGSGTAIFFREGKRSRMRWDYTSPDRQVILSDGETITMYFEELNQMIVSPASSLEQDLTYGIFTGQGKIERDFHIRPADTDEQNPQETAFTVIKLIPKAPQSQVRDIHVWVTADSLIRRLKIRDHFGTITVLSFSNMQRDSLDKLLPKEVDKLFEFSPPEGTEIIHQ